MDAWDLVVIGGGNTGLTAGSRVAAAGRKVALVDRGPVGGLCSLAGCNPKKVLVRATEVLGEIGRAAEHGIAAGGVRIDWSQVIDRKHRFTDPVPGEVEAGLSRQGVSLIRGTARFVAEDRLQVGERELSAQGFVIATGSRPQPLDLPGAEHVGRSDDLLELREPPRRLVIVGGGVVAWEFGFVFARLGCEVTLLVRGDRVLAGFDRPFLAPVLAYAETLGLRLRLAVKARRVERTADGLAVTVEGAGGQTDTLPADFVLNAAGRVPNLDPLDLARAGIKTGPRGVEVDDFLRSVGNRRVFAGGDAHGRFQLSPIASYEGRIIARNFLQGDVVRADYRVVPRAVFLTPPLAQVGLTEEQARRSRLEVVVTDHDMAGWKVFAIRGEEQARARVVMEKSSGRLLGAQLWASEAPELIHCYALALRLGATRETLEEMVYVYPTTTSALPHTLQ